MPLDCSPNIKFRSIARKHNNINKKVNESNVYLIGVRKITSHPHIGFLSRQLSRRKTAPWIGLEFGLGLVLGWRRQFFSGAIVLEPFHLTFQ